MDNSNLGDAPCGNCGTHIWNIPFIMESLEGDGKGGFWFEVQPGQQCPECSQPLRWYHLPAKKEETQCPNSPD